MEAAVVMTRQDGWPGVIIAEYWDTACLFVLNKGVRRALDPVLLLIGKKELHGIEAVDPVLVKVGVIPEQLDQGKTLVIGATVIQAPGLEAHDVLDTRI